MLIYKINIILNLFSLNLCLGYINYAKPLYFIESATVFRLIKNTFNGYNCINVFFSLSKSFSDAPNDVLIYMHKLNYSFTLIGELFNNLENDCGFLFMSDRNQNIPVHLTQFFKNGLLGNSKRILYIYKKKNIFTLKTSFLNLSNDADIVLANVAYKENVFVKSRYSHFFNAMPIQSGLFFYGRNHIPLTVNYTREPIQLVTFHCPIFGSLTENGLGDGVETKIYKEIEKKIKFTTKLFMLKDGKRWGTAYPNGSISGGILKHLSQREADIGFCSLWIEASKFKHINLSNYWGILCLRFLIPKPKLLPTDWSNIFKPLPEIIWILILITVAITFLFSRLIGYVKRKFTRMPVRDVSALTEFFEIIGILVSEKHPSSNSSNRHLFLWWSVFAMIISTLYSSSLVSHLTYPQSARMIETVEDMVKAGYYWGTPYEPPKTHIFNLQNPWHAVFADRYSPEIGFGIRVHRIRSGNYSVFVKCIGDKHFMEIETIPNNILRELRAPRSCLNYYLLGFGYRKGFPLSKIFDHYIRRLVESGITEYWLNRQFEKQYPLATFRKVFEYKIPPEEIEFGSLSINNLLGVFAIFFFGIILASVAFVAEINIKTREIG